MSGNASKVKGVLGARDFTFRGSWVMRFLDEKTGVFERHMADIVRYAAFGTKPSNEVWRDPLRGIFAEIDADMKEAREAAVNRKCKGNKGILD